MGPDRRVPGPGGCFCVKGMEWLIGLAVAAGTVGLGILKTLLKADLEDVTVCQWAVRQLIYLAAQRLPRDQRTRWREEWIRHALDVPGRIMPLARALGICVRAGSWGRMLRGAPSPSEALIARLRAAWLSVRSWAQARARARSKQRHPAFSRRPAPPVTQVRTVGVDAEVATIHPVGIAAVGTTESTGTASLGPSYRVYIASIGEWRDGLMHLSDAEFDAWLGQHCRDFEGNQDSMMQDYRRIVDRMLAEHGATEMYWAKVRVDTEWQGRQRQQ
jgi:hypothetical protein